MKQEEKKKQDKLASEASENILGPNPVIGLSRQSIFNTMKTLAKKVLKNPDVAIKHQMKLLGEYRSIIKGHSDLGPSRGDKRFKDPAWQENRFYKKSLQMYIAWCEEMNDWVSDLDLKKLDEDRSKFILSLLTETVAPSNWITNPSAMKRAFDTGGQSFVDGFKNYLDDLLHNGGMPSQVDKSQFNVGKNLATTPGNVVFRNDLIELIQYKPATEKVHSRPLLVVPPQINKFYVFDLTPEKSLAKYTVDSGIQAFIVSWRNPTKEDRLWDLETYITALEEAIDAVRSICEVEDVNLLGACSGGITLSVMLAYLAAKKRNIIHSATLVVSLLDTASSTTDTTMGLFADEESIELARQHSHMKGVLGGGEMARVFSWMRPNDLIWNYWVNNYLHGNKPPAYDVLYWNSDCTRLPAGLHSDFLDLFKENYLTRPDSFEINDVPIDLSKIKTDMYFVSGVTDHITPWKACYHSTKLFKGSVTFILSNSGHIQSILNPPGNPKAKYFIGNNAEETPEEWMKNAKENPTSWWENWKIWLTERSGETKAAPEEMGNEHYHPLCKAPGLYVLE